MLKNSEIEILVKMETLIKENGGILTSRTAQKNFKEFTNFIQAMKDRKKLMAAKSNEYNKRNKEKHAQYNKEYYHRKKKENRA